MWKEFDTSNSFVQDLGIEEIGLVFGGQSAPPPPPPASLPAPTINSGPGGATASCPVGMVLIIAADNQRAILACVPT